MQLSTNNDNYSRADDVLEIKQIPTLMGEKWASSSNWVFLNPAVIKTHCNDLDK